MVALPTLDALNAQTNQDFRHEYPEAPERLDPNDSEHAQWVQEWGRIREEVANRWTDDAFYTVYPIDRKLDPEDPNDAEMVSYWLDMRNQIYGESGQYDWSQAGATETHPQPDVGGTVGDGGDWTPHPVTDLEDAEVASGLFAFEYNILDQWEIALHRFDKILMSASDDDASPDFADAMLNLFLEKAIGKLVDEAKNVPGGGIAVDVLKTLWDEVGRASGADKSIRLRDFYDTHMEHIGNLKGLVVNERDRFMSEIRSLLAGLLQTDLEAYAAARGQLLEMYLDAQDRSHAATQEALFADLSAEWVRTSETSYGNPGTLHVRIYEGDLSVLDVRADAPDGHKIVDKMSKQPGGMDFWNMRTPKAIVYLDNNGDAKGTVRVDAANNLANLPAEQRGNYEEVYERIIGAGGLTPWSK